MLLARTVGLLMVTPFILTVINFVSYANIAYLLQKNAESSWHQEDAQEENL